MGLHFEFIKQDIDFRDKEWFDVKFPFINDAKCNIQAYTK